MERQRKPMVQCKDTNSRAMYVPLRQCEKCKHHGGVKEIKAARNVMPPVEHLTCLAPTIVRVVYLSDTKNGTEEK